MASRHVRRTRGGAMTSATLLAALLGCAAGLAGTTPAAAQSKPQAFVGARILTITHGEIPDGTLVVQDGKIVAVGPRSEVRPPRGADVHEATGRIIMPGLVDTHTHIGSPAGGDSSAPIQPDVRVLDSIDVRDPGFQRAQAGGITTANVMSGSGHLLSGQTVYLKLRDANTIEDMAIRDADGKMMGGIKMANGTNSRRDPPFPGTRGKSASLVREAFLKALAYREKLARGEKDPEKAPDRDLGNEALLEAIDGKRIVHHHTHRHDDIITVLRLQKEFGFRVVLHHVSEGWKVANEIAAANVPSSIIVVDSPGGKIEARDLLLTTGAIMEKAGCKLAFHTDDWITDSRLFFRSAALAVRAGMTREGALRALTQAPAEMIDLGKRIGSLDRGKEADFIVLSGDPLSVYTQVLETWIDGQRVFDRSNPQDHLWAVGGMGAGAPRRLNLCCFDDEEGWE